VFALKKFHSRETAFKSVLGKSCSHNHTPFYDLKIRHCQHEKRFSLEIQHFSKQKGHAFFTARLSGRGQVFTKRWSLLFALSAKIDGCQLEGNRIDRACRRGLAASK